MNKSIHIFSRQLCNISGVIVFQSISYSVANVLQMVTQWPMINFLLRPFSTPEFSRSTTALDSNFTDTVIKLHTRRNIAATSNAEISPPDLCTYIVCEGRVSFARPRATRGIRNVRVVPHFHPSILQITRRSYRESR